MRSSAVVGLMMLTQVGCATHHVRWAGKTEQRYFNVNGMTLAADGSAALDVEVARYQRNRSWSESWAIPDASYVDVRKRYLVIPASGLAAAAEAEAAAAATNGRARAESPNSLTLLLGEAPGLPPGWELLPPGMLDPDATVDQLPAKFRDGTETRASNPYASRSPVSIGGKPYQLTVLRGDRPIQSERAWWGYPLQIVLPATWLLDAVLSPVYLWNFADQPGG